MVGATVVVAEVEVGAAVVGAAAAGEAAVAAAMAGLVAASSLRYAQHFQKVSGLTARLAWIPFLRLVLCKIIGFFFGMMDSMRVLKDGNRFT